MDRNIEAVRLVQSIMDKAHAAAVGSGYKVGSEEYEAFCDGYLGGILGDTKKWMKKPNSKSANR